MLEKIFETSQQFLKIKNFPYLRYFIKTVKLTHRMSVIAGQRGIGKTTTVIQLLLAKVEQNRFDTRILYVQADHFILGSLSLYTIAEHFSLLGGRWLAIDEIHKYPNWSQELKSIYDTFPKLELFISGSSALEIYRGSHDLIRRSVYYSMHGLSFREYLEMSYAVTLQSYSLEELCTHHQVCASEILKVCETIKINILREFAEYLKNGFYPYFFELKDQDVYRMTLEQNFHAIIETDLTALYPHLTGHSIKKIKELLMFIANAVPFVPNWHKLLTILEIGDVRTLKTYFSHLESATLIATVSTASTKLSKIESADKIYLNNTNQLFAISSTTPNIGTVRETFFLSMVSQTHRVSLPKQGDFLIDDHRIFEIGGKKKNYEQILSEKHAFLACDDIEIGLHHKIPLWLFGFLY